MNGNHVSGTCFRDRLFVALSLWQLRHGRRLTQTTLGGMVGDLRGESVAQSTMSDWFRKSVVPSVEDVGYLATVLEVDPGWLAYGNASGAPRPHDPVLAGQHPIRPPNKP